MHWVISSIALVCALVVLALVVVGLLSVLRKSARFVGRTAASVGDLVNGPAVVPPPRARRAPVPDPVADTPNDPTA